MNERENPDRWEALSAMVDGEADAGTLAASSAAWRDDAAWRRRWHDYQLIGDVLRSEELAGQGDGAAFLGRLRTRLEREPVVLAPAPVVERARVPPGATMLRRWATPAAVAAGFVMVAGVLTISRTAPPRDAPVMAQQAAPVVAAALPASPKIEPAPAWAEARVERVETASGPLIRDARLDEYLSAHKQFGGSTALGASSGFLRNATYEGAAPMSGSR